MAGHKRTMQSKYDENKVLIKNYMDFLFSECEPKDRMKLINEIARLQWQYDIMEPLKDKNNYNIMYTYCRRITEYFEQKINLNIN